MKFFPKIRWAGACAVSFLERQKACIRLIETGGLLFPLFVTVLVGITFILGGRLGAWQWWSGVLAIGAGILLWAEYYALPRMRLAVLWAVFFLALYLWGTLWSDYGGVDNSAYHYPAMRLLIEGWNPVRAPTPETLAASMGINTEECRVFHLLFMAKGVWFFNSAGHFFTQNQLNLTFPLFPFLFLAACGALWRLLRNWSWAIRLLGCALLYAWCSKSGMIVDATICLSAIGLVASMTRCLRGERNVWLPLMVFTFWMMVAKQMGLLTGFVFWCVFGMLLLLKQRKSLPKALCCGVGATLLFLVVCASPYLTSWVHYRHPFYPAMSTDVEKFPVSDITRDFKKCNEDALQMGHFGAFCNAYLSPWLVQTYYKWKLGKETFAPNCYVWEQQYPGGYSETLAPRMLTSPLPSVTRWKMLAFFFLFFVFVKRGLRIIGGFILVGMIAFPTPYLGFLRYVPWINLIPILTVCAVADRLWKFPHGVKWSIAGLVFLINGRWFFQMFVGGAIAIEAEARWEKFLNAPPPILYACVYERNNAARFLNGTHSVNVKDAESLRVMGHPSRVGVLGVKLLCRQERRLNGVEVRPAAVEEEEKYPQFEQSGIRYDPMEWELPRAAYEEIVFEPDRVKRGCALVCFALKAYTQTLPQLLWSRLGGSRICPTGQGSAAQN